MKHNLPARWMLALAALTAAPAAWAQEPASPSIAPAAAVALPDAASEARPLPRPDPNVLLDQAGTMLSRRRSVVAKLRHQAELFGRTIIGAGDYVQGSASSRLMRYELRMQFGDREVHLLDVNDGRYLWRQRQYQAQPDLQRIDVERVLAGKPVGGEANGDAAVVLGLGGLGRLLATLRKDFEFTEVFRSQLKAVPTDVPVYGVEGRWRPAVLQQLNVASAKELRSHVPDRVVIYLGCDDSFPYRIEFLREVSGSAAATTPSPKPLLVLELLEVQFDAPLDESQFRFNAGSRPFVDVTDKFIAAESAVP